MGRMTHMAGRSTRLRNVKRKHPVHEKDISAHKAEQWQEERPIIQGEVNAVASGKVGTSADEGMFAQCAWDGWRHVRGEVSLWRAVILQAITDARSESAKAENKYHRQQARVWLEGRSEDFFLTCDYAQMSPELVRELAAMVLSEHDAEPVESDAVAAMNAAMQGMDELMEGA